MIIPSRQGMAMAAEKAGLRVVRTFDDSNLGQFLGSEAYRRDVAVTDPKILRMFGPKQLWEWEKRASIAQPAAARRPNRVSAAGDVRRRTAGNPLCRNRIWLSALATFISLGASTEQHPPSQRLNPNHPNRAECMPVRS